MTKPRSTTRAIARWVSLALLLALAPLSCDRPPQPLMKQVEGAVMCPCPDNCGKVLINCICGYSSEYRADIQAMIDEGLDLDAILARWTERYGHEGLSAPTGEGFDRLAWIMPFVALLIGVPFVLLVIQRLGRSGGGAPAAPGAAPPSTDPPEGGEDLAAQLDRELQELDR